MVMSTIKHCLKTDELVLKEEITELKMEQSKYNPFVHYLLFLQN
jgi:hypothetical protein